MWFLLLEKTLEKALLGVLRNISGTLEYLIYRHGDKLHPLTLPEPEYYTVDHGLEIQSWTAIMKDIRDADYTTDPRDRKSVTSRISLVSGGAGM